MKKKLFTMCFLPFLSTCIVTLQLACAPTNEQQASGSGIKPQSDHQLTNPIDRFYTWNNVRYVLPGLYAYRFFDESVLGYQSIKEFTLTEYQPLAIVDVNLLVPDSIGKDPYIHMYSFDLIRNETISNTDFAEYKKEWIANLGNGTFNDLAELVWSSEKFKKRFPDVDLDEVKQKHYAILRNDNTRLSYLWSFVSGEADQVITYTSHLHINGTVVFIKAWLTSASSLDEVIHTADVAERYVVDFLGKNTKEPTY